jgi:hypothetical protein
MIHGQSGLEEHYSQRDVHMEAQQHRMYVQRMKAVPVLSRIETLWLVLIE